MVNGAVVLEVPKDEGDWAPILDRGYEVIADGELLVVATDTVYGVACDPFNAEAVERLFTAKRRGRHLPLPVLVHGWRQASGLVRDPGDRGRTLASAFWPGPLTLVLSQAPGLSWQLGEARGTVGLRAPDQPFLLALLRRTGPLAVTSANRSGSPTPSTVAGVVAELGAEIAVFLDDGPREGRASSIVDLSGSRPLLLRPGPLDRADLERVLEGVIEEIAFPSET